MISPIAHVAVIVPAANEQHTIADCLAGIGVAVAHVRITRPALSVQVVLVLDRCTDETAVVAARWPDVHVVISTAGRVGAAREQGFRRALERGPGEPGLTWTAHTDADSVVPANWVAHQLDHADGGAALVLGTVRPQLDPRTLRRWRAQHSDADGHPHVHGANFGIRADVLTALGGWGDGHEHEDTGLARRAELAGHVIVRTGAAAVITSGRRAGRTPGGFAGYLRTLAADPVP